MRDVPTERGAHIPLGDCLGILVLCGLLYALLVQSTWYGDGAQLLGTVHEHRRWLGLSHPFGLTVLRAPRAATAPIGWSLHTSCVSVSVVGMAIGVTLFHAASRALGTPRAAALWGTALVAAAPPVLFFATVVELHGGFFALAGLSALSTARYARAPNPARGVLLALVWTVAFGMHATGALLPAAFLPVAIVRAGAAVKHAVVPCVAFALGVLGLQTGLQCLGDGRAGSGNLRQLSFAVSLAMDDPLAFVRTPWQEWLRPYAPLAVIASLGLVLRRHRSLAVALHLSLLPYLVVSFLSLGRFTEYGAYLLPLLWPGTEWAVHALPRRVLGATVLLSLAFGGSAIVRHERPDAMEFRASSRAMLAEGDVLFLVAHPDDYGRMLIGAPELPYVDLLAFGSATPKTLPTFLQAFDKDIRRRHAAGTCVLLSTQAVALLELQSVHVQNRVGPLVTAHLRRRYVWQRVSRPGISAYRLIPCE